MLMVLQHVIRWPKNVWYRLFHGIVEGMPGCVVFVATVLYFHQKVQCNRFRSLSIVVVYQRKNRMSFYNSCRAKDYLAHQSAW